MSTSQRSILCNFALLLCLNAVLSAQSATPQEPPCFSIHVRLNGKPVDDPRTITYKTKNDEQTVHLEGACFKVPAALLKEKTIDVFFTVPGNKIYLSSIQVGFFAGPWDVDLADKRFGSNVVLPKRARTKEACAVVFHVGEPETVLAMAPCRSPLPSKGRRPAHPSPTSPK